MLSCAREENAAKKESDFKDNAKIDIKKLFAHTTSFLAVQSVGCRGERVRRSAFSLLFGALLLLLFVSRARIAKARKQNQFSDLPIYALPRTG